MTAEELISIACEVCGIRVADLENKTRAVDTSSARRLAHWFLYWELRLSIAEIRKATKSCQRIVYKNISPKMINDHKRRNKTFQTRFSEVERRLKNHGTPKQEVR